MPMFVSIDCHSEKCIIPHILSSNMLIFVSVCIAEKGTGNREQCWEQGTGNRLGAEFGHQRIQHFAHSFN